MAPALAILFGAAIICWGAMALCFDGLVRIQFRDHFEQWVDDGRPAGIFWRPKGENTRWQGRLILFPNVIARTPHWVDNDFRAQAWLTRMRIAYWLCVVSSVMLVTLAISAGLRG